MNAQSPLAPKVAMSPTKGLSILRPKGKGSHSILVGSLMLTSLIDAFSILVIFLLMNTSNSIQEVELKAMNGMPIASHTDALKKGVILAIENGRYKIGDEIVQPRDLSRRLTEEKSKMEAGQIVAKKAELIIQAARGMSYDDLSPILVAASEASFQSYKLAVVESVR
ncbi:MAG: biopolymer transporter ExbD [Bdellovibrionaceae bacterium]|nr:biopolymer transporter ExbD [Pseudobdellovibrionaceae bacterium]